MTKRLYRSRTSRMIGGVCGGLAEYFDIDPVIVRALTVVATFGYGIGFLAYIVLWIIVPERSKVYLDATSNAFVEKDEFKVEPEEEVADINKRKIFFGAAMVVIGFLFFISNFVPSIEWEYIFPLLIIGLGIYIIFKSQKTKSAGGSNEIE